MPTRLAATALVATLGLGVFGDALLRATPWGLNFLLWTVALLGVAAYGHRLLRSDRLADIAVVLFPAALFAACVAWRDSHVLRAWNVLAFGSALTLPVLRTQGVKLWAGRVSDYVRGIMATGFNAAFGPILLAGQDVEWHLITGQGRLRHAGSVLVGALLAIPITLVFGSLLMSADPVFDSVIRSVFDWNFETIISHLMLTAFIAWATAGYFRALLKGDAVPSMPRESWRKPTLGLVELSIPLGILTFLFLIFVVVQARYLFGGEEIIRTTTGLSYAEYARRGFFELVAVIGLVLPLLLAADWLLDRQNPKTVQSFRALAAGQLLLVAFIMASALVRMRLYVDAYGLTESRVYATAIMIWFGAALVWFGVTILRDRARRYAFGAVVSGFAVMAGLNVINPDALIVRTNVARAEAGRELDLTYLGRLSADAVPTLTGRLGRLQHHDRCEIARTLQEQWTEEEDSDWRTWNIARWRATRALSPQPSAVRGCEPSALSGQPSADAATSN
ncbi:MAG: DUF4173 domain-containing protein [Gemmatimonadales bacterium]|nr:DUF4173 domain-containing protein [Gemmatimonadales bacterium]NIN10608.1 DUF4173 domain-containing protein [Gemmatimonadales bacterium]NIN49370.1 DUF4173 domain-containing protein [Gemmatimonadales bacterium]NIP06834.1 DUF4173 domain-containing protein [Gemmatimonadales bacterium]NIR01508.1 DUF4173 domain-containing protein [Gemmatimonadales bacterium]